MNSEKVVTLLYDVRSSRMVLWVSVVCFVLTARKSTDFGVNRGIEILK